MFLKKKTGSMCCTGVKSVSVVQDHQLRLHNKKQVDVICHFFEKYFGNICFRRKNGLLSYKNKNDLNLLVIYMYNWDFQL